VFGQFKDPMSRSQLSASDHLAPKLCATDGARASLNAVPWLPHDRPMWMGRGMTWGRGSSWNRGSSWSRATLWGRGASWDWRSSWT